MVPKTYSIVWIIWWITISPKSNCHHIFFFYAYRQSQNLSLRLSKWPRICQIALATFCHFLFLDNFWPFLVFFVMPVFVFCFFLVVFTSLWANKFLPFFFFFFFFFLTSSPWPCPPPCPLLEELLLLRLCDRRPSVRLSPLFSKSLDQKNEKKNNGKKKRKKKKIKKTYKVRLPHPFHEQLVPRYVDTVIYTV